MSPTTQSLHRAVQQARVTHTPIPSREDSWGVSLADAYAIQTARTAEQPLVGYKLGLVSPAKQGQMGIRAPIIGRITEAMLGGSVLRFSNYMQPRAEPELAIRLAQPIAPGSSPAQAWAAVAQLHLGLDLLDSVWQHYRFTAAEVVADNASAGNLLLGPQLPHDLHTGELRLHMNGRLVAAGSIAALGSLPTHLAWLAATVGGLLAGQVVFFGSPAPAVPLTPGWIDIEGPGEVSFSVPLH